MSPGSHRSPRFAFGAAGALDVLAMLVAAATIAVSLAALGGRLWWGFELFTHFRVQYLAVQLPLAAVLLAVRRPRWCAALALAALPNALALVPYLPTAAPAPTARAAADSEPLTLMAVNVEWRNRSAERLLETIAAESPDVVLVVELTRVWRERLRPLHADYPHRLMAPEARAFGIGLLSRYPLRDARAFKLESTRAIDARIAAPRGTLRLLGVHLKPPTRADDAAERARQLDALVELRETIDEPLAIAGDLNLTPYSPHFTGWLRRTGLRDAREGRGPAATWPTFLPLAGIPIDHVVVSPELGVGVARTLPAFGSDHYPILVELFMEAGQ